jgi:hypothetical protein
LSATSRSSFVSRAIDLAHATRAEQRDDVVRTDPRSRRQRHCVLIWLRSGAAPANSGSL